VILEDKGSDESPVAAAWGAVKKSTTAPLQESEGRQISRGNRGRRRDLMVAIKASINTPPQKNTM
jgi:hypothetical protein